MIFTIDHPGVNVIKLLRSYFTTIFKFSSKALVCNIEKKLVYDDIAVEYDGKCAYNIDTGVITVFSKKRLVRCICI